jgi:NADH-quinone oxidoreductase subunit A
MKPTIRAANQRYLATTSGRDKALTMYFDFGNVLVFFLLGLGLAGMMLGLGRLLRPSNPLAPKLTTYECGEPPTGSAWINFNIRFYLVALIFVVFDVELAFMYPVVAVYRDWLGTGRGITALVELLLFVGVLAVGLVYVWVKRDLEWVKRVPVEASEDVRRAA